MDIAGCRRPVLFNINGSNMLFPAVSCKIAGSSVTVSVHTKKINLCSKPVSFVCFLGVTTLMAIFFTAP